MWKPSLKIILSLMILMAVLGGITFNFVDWDIIKNGQFIEIYDEINLSVVFFLLSISFMATYLKRLKKESKD